MYRRFIKRMLDILLSLFLLPILAVPMFVIAVVIKIDSVGPVFILQKRIGKGCSEFRMPKFRTMYADAPLHVPTHLLHDSARWITPAGRFLRRTSMDELPQIFAILVGKMSFIGPRPALWNQHDLIAEREKYGANDVLPGLTGWAQINGRDELSMEEKARYDGEYARRMSFRFDCRCLFGTVGKVLRQDGVVEGQAQAKERAER